MIDPNKYDSVLVKDSLAETLWRLEEVRMGFAVVPRKEVNEALDWVQERQGIEGAYSVNGHKFFAPAERDKKKVELITGEKFDSTGGTDHILGQEALRALILWGRGEENETQEALKALFSLLEVEQDFGTPRESGYFCCAKCSVSMLKTISVVKTDDWEETLEEGINKINQNRDDDGRWGKYPFYYTLLALSEIENESAIGELRYAAENNENLLKRYEGKDDRKSIFRKIGLETAISVIE